MILFKGKNKEYDILKNLEKEFGVIFHPRSTVKMVEMLKEKNGSNNSKGQKPKQPVFQDNKSRTNLETKAGETES